ncbi:MAG: ABC transporter permease [Longimicrobiales bacterium]
MHDPPTAAPVAPVRGRLLTDLREVVVELGEFRELFVAVTRRDLKLRYQNAIMGFGWAVAMPLLNMLIFTVIFTRVVRLDTGMPYPLYAFAGLLPWNLLASSLRFATTSLTSNPNLVTKVYFPREILPLSAVATALLDFAVASIVLGLLMAWYGIAPSSALLFLPVVLAVQLVFTAALALALAMANLFYADVKYVFEVGITVWMFATSVVYPVERIGGALGQVLLLNPMTPIIDAYRAVLLRGELPPAGPFAGAAVLAVVMLGASWLLFHRAEFRFAEEV